MLMATWAARGLFKGAALVVHLFSLSPFGYGTPRWLTTAADENLRLVKLVAGLLPLDWASKVESALRMFEPIAPSY